MSHVLSARLSHVRVVSSLWKTSVRRALEHVLNMDDLAVLVDVLNASQRRLLLEMSTEIAQDMLPAIGRLLDSEFEDYVICGITTLGLVLRAVGHVVRDAAIASVSGLNRSGVDLQLEDRQERCRVIREGLLGMQALLQVLATGANKGRSAQLAARVGRSLARCVDCGGQATLALD